MPTNFCPPTANAGESTPRLIEKLLTGAILMLTLGVTLAASPGHSQPAPAAPNLSQPTQNNLTAKSLPLGSLQILPNGIYLYGQVAKGDQIGKTYMVFQVRDRQMVGAFYMPSSSFDCMHGTFQPKRLALTVIDSEAQTSYPYSVALQTKTSVAQAQSGESVPVELAGFHRIATLSSNDQKILSTCQSTYQAFLPANRKQ